MHGSISTAGNAAIKAPVRSDSGKNSTFQTDSDDNEWFVAPARDLLGSDPGLALHVLTGISESSGYRYANGSRAVPGNLVRWLLRSDHGRQWLNAIMDGSTVEWWRDYRRAERISFALKDIGED